ncbi:unnamed protein product [Fraxinus pennsylvanica]|uniref:Uncharacterized protein n=1 Tax=Fraxinus pennsylvanica TaxID=56036 RepID=A0AAD2A013_9LAMI|nr:unnamed protein product [Fraxinus pennsylvanica]
MKYKHEACAALLNPSATEPLTWPSPCLKFINELSSEVKALLEKVLIMANKEREKTILKETSNSLLKPLNFGGIDNDIKVCYSFSSVDSYFDWKRKLVRDSLRHRFKLEVCSQSKQRRISFIL